MRLGEVAEDVWYWVGSWVVPVYVVGGFAVMVYAERVREKVRRAPWRAP